MVRSTRFKAQVISPVPAPCPGQVAVDHDLGSTSTRKSNSGRVCGAAVDKAAGASGGELAEKEEARTRGLLVVQEDEGDMLVDIDSP